MNRNVHGDYTHRDNATNESVSHCVFSQYDAIATRCLQVARCLVRLAVHIRSNCCCSINIFIHSTNHKLFVFLFLSVSPLVLSPFMSKPKRKILHTIYARIVTRIVTNTQTLSLSLRGMCLCVISVLGVVFAWDFYWRFLLALLRCSLCAPYYTHWNVLGGFERNLKKFTSFSFS